MASDRAEFTNFIDLLKKSGLIEGTDFWRSPGGDAQVSMRVDLATDPRFAAAKKKFGMHSLVGETAYGEATDYIKESAYVVGEKVKVWMGGNKKALGEIKKVAFGDGFYFVEVAGNVVSRSLHELEPFIEGKDKVAKKVKVNLSLDEAVDSALEEDYETETLDKVGHEDSDINNDGEIDSTDDYLSNRRKIIGRERENMTTDEAVEEALNMNDIHSNDKSFSGYSNCCNAPVYGESDICSSCKEHCEVIPAEEPTMEEEKIEESFLDEEGGSEQEEFEKYLAGEQTSFKPSAGGHAITGIGESKEALKEYKDYSEFVKVADSSFINGVGYDDDLKTMIIKFKYGVYEYYNVPRKIFDAFLEAPSMGKFFHINIKKVYDYALSQKFKKRGEIGFTGATKAFPNPKERNEELVGSPLQEDHLSEREEIIDFIVKNIDSIPETSEVYRFAAEQDEQGLIDYLTAQIEDDELGEIYSDVERAMENSSIDSKTEGVIIEMGEMQHHDEGVFGSETEQYKMINALDELGWESYLDELSTYEMTCAYNPNDDTFVIEMVGENQPISQEQTESIFEVTAEEEEIFESLVKSKGYKFLEAKGTSIKGIANILVEKNGFKTTITYNDNAAIKPWKWEHREFNFMQEALDSVYIPKQFTLEEGLKLEAEDFKNNEGKIKMLVEQRKFADKTTDLSKSEIERRAERSKDLIKKFMNPDLLNRKFDR